MPAPNRGVNSYIGVKDETVWGTPVVVDRFPILSEDGGESIQVVKEMIRSGGMRAGNFNAMNSGSYATYIKGIEGDLSLEWMNKGMSWWLKHMLGGTVTTTGTGAPYYLHTFPIGTQYGKSFTLQVVRDAAPETYAGCKIDSWELACGLDEILKINFSIKGKGYTRPAAAVASYPIALFPLHFGGGAVTVAGVATDVKAFSLSANNNLPERRFFGLVTKEPTDQAREYTGSFEVEFDDTTLYDLFLAGTEVAITAVFVGPLISGSDYFTLTITIPLAILDGKTPNAENTDIIENSHDFTVLGQGMTWAVRTNEATP